MFTHNRTGSYSQLSPVHQFSFILFHPHHLIQTMGFIKDTLAVVGIFVGLALSPVLATGYFLYKMVSM